MSYGDQSTYDDIHFKYHDSHHYQNHFPVSSSLPAEYDQSRFHLSQPPFGTFVQPNHHQQQFSYHQNLQNVEYSYDANFVSAYPSSSSYPPPRLTPPSLPRSQPQQLSSPADSIMVNASHRLPLAGSLDPSTGIFYRTPEHPRLRTAQACEKCRTRKAKCSGEHPSCKRCLTRGLICQYAKEGRVRGPNKPKIKTQNSNSSSSSSNSNSSSSKASQSADTTATTPSPKSSNAEDPTHRFSSVPALSISSSPSPAEPTLTPSSTSESSSPSSLLTSPLSAGSGSNDSAASPLDLFPQAARESLSVDEHRSSRPRPPDLQLHSSSNLHSLTPQERQNYSTSRPNTAIPNVQGYPMTPSHILDMQSQSASPSPGLRPSSRSTMASYLRVSTPNDERFPHDSMYTQHASSVASRSHSQSSSLSSLSMTQSSMLSPLQVGIDREELPTVQQDLSLSPSPRDHQASVSYSDGTVKPDSSSRFELSYPSELRAEMHQQRPRILSGLGIELSDSHSHAGCGISLHEINHLPGQHSHQLQRIDQQQFHQRHSMPSSYPDMM